MSIKEVPEGKEFVFGNGKKACNLKELAEIISNLTEEEFKNHVNDERNDFANWIKDVLEETILSEEIKNLKTKEAILNSIKNKTEIKENNEEVKPKSIIEKEPIKEKIQEKEQTEEENKEEKGHNEHKKETILNSIKNKIHKKEEKEIKLEKPHHKKHHKEFLIMEFIIGLIVGLIIGILIGYIL